MAGGGEENRDGKGVQSDSDGKVEESDQVLYWSEQQSVVVRVEGEHQHSYSGRGCRHSDMRDGKDRLGLMVEAERLEVDSTDPR